MTRRPNLSPSAKWQVVENVVTAIEKARSSVPGMKITQKAMLPERDHPESKREIDVLIEIPIGPRVVRIGIEVKHETRPVDITTMEGLGAKKSKLDIDRLCVVSTSGFTRGAEREATAKGIELTTVEEFEESDWWLAPPYHTVRTRAVEATGVRLELENEEELQAWRSLGTLQAQRIEIQDPKGTKVRLHNWLVQQGIKDLQTSGADKLRDQDQYVVRILVPPGLTFLVGNSEMPTPAAVLGRYRLHRETKLIPERRFRTPDGIEAFSAQYSVAGEERQMTFLSVPAESGKKQLKLAIGPARPKTSC